MAGKVVSKKKVILALVYFICLGIAIPAYFLISQNNLIAKAQSHNVVLERESFLPAWLAQPLGEKISLFFGHSHNLYAEKLQLSEKHFSIFKKVDNLKYLSLAQSQNVATAMKELPRYSDLVFLDLSGTDVKNEDLSQLTSLSELSSLYLSQTSLTDEALPYLMRLKKLKTLLCHETAISQEGRKKLLMTLPGLRF